MTAQSRGVIVFIMGSSMDRRPALDVAEHL